MDEACRQPGYRIRAIAPRDREGLAQFYATLSEASLAARFHCATHGIRDDAARRFCGPDHEHREGLVAVTTETPGEERIVAHLCLEPTGLSEVEMAIAVADAWQHRGIGRALLAAGIDWVQVHGVERLRASMLWGNGAIFGLLRSSGCPVTLSMPEAGVVDAILDVRALARTAA